MSDKTVAEKLLIKGGQKVLLVNPPNGYKAVLGEIPQGVTVLKEGAEAAVDLIQVFVASRGSRRAVAGAKALARFQGTPVGHLSQGNLEAEIRY